MFRGYMCLLQFGGSVSPKFVGYPPVDIQKDVDNHECRAFSDFPHGLPHLFVKRLPKSGKIIGNIYGKSWDLTEC